MPKASPTRFTLAAIAALVAVLLLHKKPPDQGSVAECRALNHQADPHHPSGRHHRCGHCSGDNKLSDDARSASRRPAQAHPAVAWDHSRSKSAAPGQSLTILGEDLRLRGFQKGHTRHLELANGSRIGLTITGQHTYPDGTMAVSATVAGKPNGRLHLQWNDADNFFLGQIYYDGLPVAYQITRNDQGQQIITRHSIDQLVCSEIDPASGKVTLGLPGIDEALAASPDMLAPSADGSTSTSSSSSSVPVLNSYPDATAVIYLDFDGEQVTGTSWGQNISAAATGYSEAKITTIWQRVAADFEPFNINVSTDEARYLNTPASKRIRCIITPSNEWYGSNSAGGVAKYNSFAWSGDTPCWVFSDNLANNSKYVAEACSHEVGHTLGLSHDGKTGTTYYAGHGSGTTSWAPIMGSGYFKTITQWSKGEYSNATNTQDDLRIITSSANGFGYRPDDHGNKSSAATRLDANSSLQLSATGTIEQSNDVDIFKIDSASGDISLSVTPASSYGNLDIQTELYDSAGKLISSSNPASETGANINLSVNQGTYYLHVRATGYGNADTGFTDYASLGSYRISGQLPAGLSPFLSSVAHLPEHLRNPTDDPDADGCNNLLEHAMATDPGSPDNNQGYFLALDTSSSSGPQFIIDLPENAPTDVSYTIEASCTMHPDDWTPIATLGSSGTWSGSATVTEVEGPNGKRRFRISENNEVTSPCRFLRVSLILSP